MKDSIIEGEKKENPCAAPDGDIDLRMDGFIGKIILFFEADRQMFVSLPADGKLLTGSEPQSI
jgi:hypothetical protein